MFFVYVIKRRINNRKMCRNKQNTVLTMPFIGLCQKLHIHSCMATCINWDYSSKNSMDTNIDVL